MRLNKDNVSDRSLRRAKADPERAMAVTLATVAEQEKKSMEEMLGRPLYIDGIRIDGYYIRDGLLYCFSRDLPEIPPRGALYVYLADDGEYHMDKRRYIKNYVDMVGIVTMMIQPHDLQQRGSDVVVCWTW